MSQSHSAARFPTTRLEPCRSGQAIRPTPRPAPRSRSSAGDYWFPLYAFARHRGSRLTRPRISSRAFSPTCWNEAIWRGVDRSKGRFRSFLRAACEHYLANRRDHDRAAKRGRGGPIVPIDRLDAESRYDREPVHRADRRTIVRTAVGTDLARARLDGGSKTESARSGKWALFDQLRRLLQGITWLLIPRHRRRLWDWPKARCGSPPTGSGCATASAPRGGRPHESMTHESATRRRDRTDLCRSPPWAAPIASILL